MFFTFETPLQHGLRERTAGVEAYAQSAARQDFGVERLQQRHIDRAVQTEVELLRAAQMGPAVGGEIGSTSRQVEVFDAAGFDPRLRSEWARHFVPARARPRR